MATDLTAEREDLERREERESRRDLKLRIAAVEEGLVVLSRMLRKELVLDDERLAALERRSAELEKRNALLEEILARVAVLETRGADEVRRVVARVERLERGGQGR